MGKEGMLDWFAWDHSMRNGPLLVLKPLYILCARNVTSKSSEFIVENITTNC